MLDIRPVSDLRNNFTEIEKKVSKGRPIVFSKNGRGSMVLMSLDKYNRMANVERVEIALDEADEYAQTHSEDMTHEDIFLPIKAKLVNAKKL